MTEPVALLPLDGSSTAETMLPVAAAFARRLGLQVLLLDLVREAWPGGNERAEAALQAARHYLDGVAANLRSAGIEVETRAVPGSEDVATGINATAAEVDAALIMLATHGRSGPRRWIIGSVTSEVVQTAERPVLVVRAEPGTAGRHDGTIRRILLPLDGSPRAEVALEEAARLARAFGAVLNLVQVVQWAAALVGTSTEFYATGGLDQGLESAAQEYLAGVRRRLPADVTVEAQVLRGDAAGGILDHAAATGADLVVMSTHGRSGIARWELGSVADRIVRSSHLPVLLLRSTNDD
jgi:nucleotide-binding universal stress UspA family protein